MPTPEELRAFAETLSDRLATQDEIRIYIDVRADGTGHIQAGLDQAARLREMGYDKPISFVLGTPLFEVQKAPRGDGVNLYIDREWTEKLTKFQEVADSRHDLGPYRILSDDCFSTNENLAKVFAKVFSDDAADFELTDEFRAINPEDDDNDFNDSAELIDFVRQNLPNHSGVELSNDIVDLSLCGAADGENNLARKTGTDTCITLQPSGWAKGTPGIWQARGGFTPLEAEVNQLPLCSINAAQVGHHFETFRVNEAAHFAPYDALCRAVVEPHRALSPHADHQWIVCYNLAAMKVPAQQVLANLVAVYEASGKPFTILDLHSNGVESAAERYAALGEAAAARVRPLVIEPVEEDAEAEAIAEPAEAAHDAEDAEVVAENAAEAPAAAFDLNHFNGCILQGAYLPSVISDMILTNASLLVCEGQGMAAKAMALGTPVLHAPKNAPRDVLPADVDHHPRFIERCNPLSFSQVRALTNTVCSKDPVGAPDATGAVLTGKPIKYAFTNQAAKVDATCDRLIAALEQADRRGCFPEPPQQHARIGIR